MDALLRRRAISRRSLIAGVIGTILFHLIGFLWMPSNVFTTERTKIQDRFREYEVELMPPDEEEPEQVYTLRPLHRVLNCEEDFDFAEVCSLP